MFPYDAAAAESDPGGALFVPAPSPLGRIANPKLYRELYFSDCPEGAVAESFGFLPVWSDDDFTRADGVTFAVGTYELPDSASILDLDDVHALSALNITKPSAVVTRRRSVTQAWAKAIYLKGSSAGVRWWSYYNPQWSSVGLWKRRGLRHAGPPSKLSTAHPAVIAAARAIVRQLSP